MPDADRPRRPFDNLSQPVRFAMAVAGFAIGLLLVYVGARSCETSLTEPPAESVPVGITTPATRG